MLDLSRDVVSLTAALADIPSESGHEEQIADEVQAGFGRTGTMFTVEQSGITPDILVMAKGIASGFPFAAIGASAELMSRWPTGSHGGTYGGNPIGCAAASRPAGSMASPTATSRCSTPNRDLPPSGRC